MGSKAAIAAGAGLGATVLFAPAAEAATFTVTNLNDAGADSLRQAVLDANTAGGADVIAFQSGLTGTITLTTGEIDIAEELDVQGPGADVITVSGNDASRIFYVDPTVGGNDLDPVTISGLTLAEGNASDPGGANQGGALYSENATLTLADMVFSGNYANEGGGAVYSDEGKLTVTNSLFTGNTIDSGEGGAIYVDNTEGSAADDVEVLIQDSVFTNNTAGSTSDGGALYLDADGDVLIERTTFTGNGADNDGGGLFVQETVDGDLTIQNSTFSGNTAEDGGGMRVGGVDGTTLIQNTTVSGNRADFNGGGIYFDYLPGDQTTTIRNSTIVDNAATVGPTVSPAEFYGGGGVYLADFVDDPDDDGPVAISSTIVANNSAFTGNDLLQGPFADGFNVGFSLIEDPAGATITESPAGSNITATDPALGPLADNGGPTQTHEPLFTSQVLDAGIANGLTTDQRGFARIVELPITNRIGSDGTDIGSVEVQACQDQPAHAHSSTDADDTITGTPEADLIAAGGGNDTANALAGNDCVAGDAGNDKLSGDEGKDLVSGGEGKDRLKGNAGKDKVSGAGGKDTLNGDAGKDKVSGGAGKDRIKGGNAKDKIKGNGGKDAINAIDGKADKVNCGGGKDTAKVDAVDKVSANCEVVKVKGG